MFSQRPEVPKIIVSDMTELVSDPVTDNLSRETDSLSQEDGKVEKQDGNEGDDELGSPGNDGTTSVINNHPKETVVTGNGTVVLQKSDQGHLEDSDHNGVKHSLSEMSGSNGNDHGHHRLFFRRKSSTDPHARRGSLVAHLLHFVGMDRRGSSDLRDQDVERKDSLLPDRKLSSDSDPKDSPDMGRRMSLDNWKPGSKDNSGSNRRPSVDLDLTDIQNKARSGGRRKLSIFGNVLRRVSIHRKESMPANRRSVFFFKGHNSEDTSDESSDGNGNLDKAENGHSNGVGRKQHKMEQKQLNKQVLVDGLFMILSGLYGILLVVMGAVIPLTGTFVEPESGYVFEGFYIYLYSVSIIFLIYVYVYLLRRNRLKTEFLTRTLSRSMSWTKAWAKSWAKGEATDQKNKRKRHISMDTNHHTGSFYLRLGAVGFGIGSMIHSGLHFGQYFQVYDGPDYCTDLIQAFKPLLHLMFTFIQLYLIFMNSKLRIHRYRTLARFGLMHMCATNICVWFRSIVVETLHVIHQQHDVHHDVTGHDIHEVQVFTNGYKTNDTTYNTSGFQGRRLHAVSLGTGSANNSCRWSDMMGQAVESAGPYLYPCTIEYSLMCAGILYVMWTNVGERQTKVRTDSDAEDEEEDLRSHQRMSVDCAGSSRGLFLGILITVGVIISIIAFYVLINQRKETLHLSAIVLTHMSETIIYLVTTVALCLAVSRMKDLHFHAERKSDLEDTLILISYTGLLGFATFSLTAAFMKASDVRSWFTIISSLAMVIQATLQTIFILAGDRLSAASSSQERKKPGREFVTFLLLSNFAMWALNTFETQTPEHNPIQVEVYGHDAWAIFTHVSVPLGIYFRFHSTVCLSNIWKNAWKVRKHM